MQQTKKPSSIKVLRSMPTLEDLGSEDALVEEFFGSLRNVAQKLLESPLDRHQDVPVAIERLSREHATGYHRGIASMAPGEYAKIGNQLVRTAEQLADQCMTINGLQLTLDWMVSAPKRLASIILFHA